MIGIHVRVAALLAVAALVAAGCGGGGALGPRSLAKQTEAVQSLAAEGALLASDAAAGRSTGTFRREHAAELAKAASSARTSLASATTTSALRPQLRRLRGIAARVQADLARLQDASRAEQHALARRLDGDAKASATLGEAIG